MSKPTDNSSAAPPAETATDGAGRTMKQILESATKSKNKFARDGWGTRTNFQHSVGLKVDPDSMEEGDRIIEMMQEADMETYEEVKAAAGFSGGN